MERHEIIKDTHEMKLTSFSNSMDKIGTRRTKNQPYAPYQYVRYIIYKEKLETN